MKSFRTLIVSSLILLIPSVLLAQSAPGAVASPPIDQPTVADDMPVFVLPVDTITAPVTPPSAVPFKSVIVLDEDIEQGLVNNLMLRDPKVPELVALRSINVSLPNGKMYNIADVSADLEERILKQYSTQIAERSEGRKGLEVLMLKLLPVESFTGYEIAEKSIPNSPSGLVVEAGK